jgi:hypothetical protein
MLAQMRMEADLTAAKLKEGKKALPSALNLIWTERHSRIRFPAGDVSLRGLRFDSVDSNSAGCYATQLSGGTVSRTNVRPDAEGVKHSGGRDSVTAVHEARPDNPRRDSFFPSPVQSSTICRPISKKIRSCRFKDMAIRFLVGGR